MDYSQEFLQVFFELLTKGFYVFLPMLASVYIMGRMLGFINSNRGRNFVALIIMFPSSWLVANLFYEYYTIITMLGDIVFFGSVSILLYVLVGFKLFPRIDNLLDKKIGSDEEEKPKRRKK